jgi:hypothetical protein
MSAPPLRHSLEVCRSKRRHPDEITARCAAQAAIQTHKLMWLFVYQCSECRGWHLTKRAQKGGHKVTWDDFGFAPVRM